MLFVHTPKAANKRPETHALQLCPAPAASAQKKPASWGFPRESVWVRESQQQRPVPPRAYSRPRGRGESQASLCCPSWRAGGGRGGPRLGRPAATTSPRRVAPRSPRARANPPSCSACPARLAPNPAGTLYPGFPKTCWQGPRPSAGTRPSPRPPPHPLHPRRLLPLRDRRPLPRPWSPSVVSTARPGPRGVSRSHPRARARRCHLLLLAPPNQPPSGVEAQSRPF